MVFLSLSCLGGACAKEKGSLERAVEALAEDIGEPIAVDHCPPLPELGTVLCAAHLESGVAFDLAVTRSPGELNVHTVGMAAGRDVAHKLYAAYAARGLELPDMRCPALVRVDGEAVTCRTTVQGVPVAVKARIANRRISFELAGGVIAESELAHTIGRLYPDADASVIECGFDLRLSLPGTEFACGLAARDGTPPRVAWVRVEDTRGRVAMSGRPHGR